MVVVVTFGMAAVTWPRTPKQSIAVGAVQVPQLGVLLTGLVTAGHAGGDLCAFVLIWWPELSPVTGRMPGPLWV